MDGPKQKSENYANFGGMNSKVSAYQTGPQEFTNLQNVDFSAPGALKSRPGSSLYVGATLAGRITGLYEFSRLNGSSWMITTANTNAYYANGSVFTAFKTGLQNNAIFSFSTLVDRLFAANGNDYFKWDGNQTTLYSLPPGATGWGITAALGTGMSGVFSVSYGYENDRGYFGPASNGLTSPALDGVTWGSLFYFGLTTPAGYGISALVFYRSAAGNPDQFRTTLITGSTNVFTDFGNSLGIAPLPPYVWFTMAPKYLEIYNNQLFMAGFSNFLSSTYWSDVGEPEGVSPDFNAEVRTNDGDRITALKSLGAQMLIFKERSYHRITGDDPNTFLLTEVSDQYGCVSNRATASYENNLLFLDTKGVCYYDGFQSHIISTKIEPVFKSMNQVAAMDNAVAIHNRLRNEVWFGIPTNGATFNNTTVIYDYAVDAWTVWNGFNPSALTYALGSIGDRTAFYGDYSGSIHYMGVSLFSDNGNPFTTVIKTRFLSDQGQSIQKLWRRLYTNLDPIAGVTCPISVNLYADFSAAIAYTGMIYSAVNQTRLDFGLSAKTMAVEYVASSASCALKIDGFTVEYRILRMV